MQIYKCDICQEIKQIEDVYILYGRKISFCNKCKNKAKRIKLKIQKTINYYEKQKLKDINKLNLETDQKIKEAEKNILRRKNI